jgi:imidazole glycerol phosphate synthase subunit HisF
MLIALLLLTLLVTALGITWHNASLLTAITHTHTPTPILQGEKWCWWQATVKGGREGRDIDAIAVAVAVEALGAGEIMLNAIDCDGTGGVSTSSSYACADLHLCLHADIPPPPRHTHTFYT